MKRNELSDLVKMLDNYIPVPESGCWIYLGTLDSKGYGVAKKQIKQVKMTRVSYEHYNGPIPEGHFVCHKCDTPQCINPEHLFAGTNSDNMKDMYSKGRGKPKLGPANPQAKLSEQDIERILSDNRTQARIAKDYGVSQSCICNVKKRGLKANGR